MRISDWSSDVCSSDLLQAAIAEGQAAATTNDDKYYLGFYTLQAGIMNKDQALQAQGLDTALASGLVPATDAAVYNFYSGQLRTEERSVGKVCVSTCRYRGSPSRKKKKSDHNMVMFAYIKNVYLKPFSNVIYKK